MKIPPAILLGTNSVSSIVKKYILETRPSLPTEDMANLPKVSIQAFKEPTMSWKGIVGKSFTPIEFEEYIRNLKLGLWTPRGITVHHTGNPTLKMRPNGFTPEHILNLQSFYRDEKHWPAAPHLFIDQTHIHVFTPLTVTGIHAVSFNKTHWGVEMLGNYDVEIPHKEVFNNTYLALSCMLRKIGKDESAVNFHRDDPLTKKSCPGTRVDKAAFRAAVAHVGLQETTHSKVKIIVDDVTIPAPSAKLLKNSVVALLSELNNSVPGIDIAGADIMVSAATFYRNRQCVVSFNNESKSLIVHTPSASSR